MWLVVTELNGDKRLVNMALVEDVALSDKPENENGSVLNFQEASLDVKETLADFIGVTGAVGKA